MPARVARVAAVKAQASSGKVKKVVLAYSGGLDTSVILKWLQDTYGCEVVTFTADLGQVGFMSRISSSGCAVAYAQPVQQVVCNGAIIYSKGVSWLFAAATVAHQ